MTDEHAPADDDDTSEWPYSFEADTHLRDGWTLYVHRQEPADDDDAEQTEKWLIAKDADEGADDKIDVITPYDTIITHAKDADPSNYPTFQSAGRAQASFRAALRDEDDESDTAYETTTDTDDAARPDPEERLAESADDDFDTTDTSDQADGLMDRVTNLLGNDTSSEDPSDEGDNHDTEASLDTDQPAGEGTAPGADDDPAPSGAEGEEEPDSDDDGGVISNLLGDDSSDTATESEEAATDETADVAPAETAGDDEASEEGGDDLDERDESDDVESDDSGMFSELRDRIGGGEDDGEDTATAEVEATEDTTDDTAQEAVADTMESEATDDEVGDVADEDDADDSSAAEDEEEFTAQVERVWEDFKQGEDREDIQWGEEIEAAVEKFKRAREGDHDAKEDVEDIPARLRATFRKGKPAREDLVDAILPTTLVLAGFFLLVIVATMPPDSLAGKLMTMETRYADLFLASTGLMALSMVGFWVSRRISGGQKLRRSSRIVLGLLQAVPFGLAAFIVIVFIGGRGELFLQFVDQWQAIKASLSATLPQFVVAVGNWYQSISPIGVTLRQTSILMVGVGLVVAVPFFYRVFQSSLTTITADPQEFWQEEADATDITTFGVEDRRRMATLRTKDEDGEEDDEEFRLGAFDRTEISDEIKELLNLPEEMKTSPYSNYVEVKRYWVRAPYSYISIVYNDRQNDYRYVVVEPSLDDAEDAILDEFDERLGTALLYEEVEETPDRDEKVEAKVERLERKVLELAQEYNIDADDETFHKLLYYIERDYVYFNKIDPLMNDPNVEDISCDGNDKYIFVFHREYKDLMSNVKFQREELRSFITQLAQRSGEHVSAADPLVDASLPDGSRIQMSLGNEITTHGSTFTIRLFKEIPFTPVDLLKYQTFDLNQMAYLWLAIEHDKSLIFAGGTASGKTTSMNAVSLFIPPKAKVVTLEDTREINLPHENWIAGTTRDTLGSGGGEAVTMYNLLEAALRQRPEYLIVGEIRGEEAETLFQAMSTGHTTYSTMHADSVDAAVGRLENPPINVPRKMIEALDIMCIQQQVRIRDDGDVKNVRRNMETRELIDLREDDSFRTHQPYRRDAERDEFIETLEDSHVLHEIQEEQGWSREELHDDLEERKEVLMYLVENDITDFELVSRTIQSYMIDSERVVEQVRDGTLDPDEFTDLTSVEWAEPETRLDEEMMMSKLPDDEKEAALSAAARKPAPDETGDIDQTDALSGGE